MDNDDSSVITKGHHNDTLEDDGSVYLKLVDSEKQMLGFRVGPVYNSDSGMDEVPGLWIEYQAEDGKSSVSGPVLISPSTWEAIKRFVDEHIDSFKRSNYVISIDAEENDASS